MPKNPTISQQTKYNICQKVIKYKRNKRLTIEQLASQQTIFKQAEMKNILHCRLVYLDLDKLMDYADFLFAPCRVELNLRGKFIHDPTS